MRTIQAAVKARDDLIKLTRSGRIPDAAFVEVMAIVGSLSEALAVDKIDAPPPSLEEYPIHGE